MNTSKRASAHASYTDWNSVNWNEIQKYVTKLRQRIYRAEQLEQQRKVRKLQRLLLRSEANLLLSIRKMTQQNKGKRTGTPMGSKIRTFLIWIPSKAKHS